MAYTPDQLVRDHIDKEVARLSFGSDHNKTLFRFSLLVAAETQSPASTGAFAPVLEETLYPSVIWRKNLWSFKSVSSGVVFVAAHYSYNATMHALGQSMTFNRDDIIDSLAASRQALWESCAAPGAKARPVGW
jgi:hypothetical protein